jgi:hypothetical protein
MASLVVVLLPLEILGMQMLALLILYKESFLEFLNIYSSSDCFFCCPKLYFTPYGLVMSIPIFLCYDDKKKGQTLLTPCF